MPFHEKKVEKFNALLSVMGLSNYRVTPENLSQFCIGIKTETGIDEYKILVKLQD